MMGNKRTARGVRWALVALGGAIVVPGVVAAAETPVPSQPAQQKAADGREWRAGGGDRGRDRGPWGGGGGPRGEGFRSGDGSPPPWGGRSPWGDREQQPPTTREAEQMDAFMREHSPKRWESLQRLPADNPFRRGISRFVYVRWKDMESLKREDPDAYAMRIRQLHIQDQVFGMLDPLKDDTAREARRSEVRSLVSEEVDLELKERQHRIERLVSSLEKEKHRLERDQARRDAMVDRRVEMLVKRGVGPPPPGQRRRGGWRDPAATQPAEAATER